jgi:hypothetical protein
MARHDPAMQIGALAPLSRPGFLEAGRHLLAGMELAAHELGVELVSRDTAGSPDRAIAAVDELAALGVDALAGEYHSVVARAVATRADALGVPFLCSSAVLDALTDAPTDRVARLAPPQSQGWTRFAQTVLDAGHTRVAVIADASLYWATGTRILRQSLDVVETDVAGVAGSGASAVLLLVAYPEPFVSAVEALRGTGLLVGAPAGQPEFTVWTDIPYLAYLPEELTPLGSRVEAALRQRLGEAPSFVAFEGYDTILALTAGTSWPAVSVDGTRGPITFSRVPGVNVWQWADAPIRVVGFT